MKHQRYHNLLKAIEEERKNEEAYYRELSKSATPKDKIESGILWYPVDIVKQRYTIGEFVEIEVERTKHLDKSHKLKTGVGCTVFKQLDERQEYKGTISFVKRNKMGIILHSDVLEKGQLSEKGLTGIELVYDERPYKVMKDAIHALINTKEHHHMVLRDGISNQDDFAYSTRNYNTDNIADNINPSQQTAIKGVMNTGHLGIIHGPPGTGKTTTLVTLIKTLLNNEKRILVCAPSNNAVDLLASKLDAAGIKVSRVGNVTRISDDLAHVTVVEKLRNHDDWQHIKKVKIEATKARKIAGNFKRKFGSKEREDRNAMYKEARDLQKWAKDLENKLVESILHDSQVVATTLIGTQQRMISDMQFDTVIIDEASQALEAECWVAILKAKRVIMAGDHMQLPPTIKSSKAIEMGLEETILNRMTACIKDSYTLGIQYRMNEKILSFPNKKFYGGKLLSHISNSTHLIQERDEPLIWIDTSGCGFEEQTSTEHRSKWNEGEYFILREHFIQQIEKYEGFSIGIIAPYAQQVRYIKSQVSEDESIRVHDVTINSIDGFQGQEKDVIYISLVRSNESGELGFLKDLRRLNVAITRAKKKLIIIGDVATLSSDQTFLELLEHVEKHGLYQSAWEYMAI